MDVARWVAERLEAGLPVVPTAMALPLARAWDAVAARRVVRGLDLRAAHDRGVRVVAVGGATLGGSGKTPVALACARVLAARGAPVAIVGHAYGAHAGRDGGVARIVTPSDSVDAVGDEALALARQLAASAGAGSSSIVVVVGRSRASALAFAARTARVVVLDGVLQTAPRPADLAILAVDGARPWGADAAPPVGDRRAPREALLAASDLVVAVVADAVERDAHPSSAPHVPLGARTARVVSDGVALGGRRVPWADVSARTVGLFTAIARPDRVVAFLAARGVAPVAHVAVADHREPKESHRRMARAAVETCGIDLWLTTPKCATHLSGELAHGLGGAPVAAIDYDVELDGPTHAALEALLASPPGPV